MAVMLCMAVCALYDMTLLVPNVGHALLCCSPDVLIFLLNTLQFKGETVEILIAMVWLRMSCLAKWHL